MFLTATYSKLLQLYPAEHKAIFAQEMATTFEHAAHEYWKQGWLAFARFFFLESATVALGVAAEWVKKKRARDYMSDRVVRALADAESEQAGTLAAEISEARRYLELNLSRMERAIARHDFVNARSFSGEDGRARQRLRLLLEKREAA